VKKSHFAEWFYFANCFIAQPLVCLKKIKEKKRKEKKRKEKKRKEKKRKEKKRKEKKYLKIESSRLIKIN
jgi:hypothetical protein